jgi:glycosyltransferase involved in cell wall biosynthesis
MKICQVISSNLPILPTGQRGWGATELITEEYSKNLRNLGHQVHIKYLNEVQPNEYDIVHIHVANLCIEAKKRGLEYIYSTHDHHSFFYGKNSWNYKQQLEAIKGSIFSIAPAEYVVDFFDDTDKLFYLAHGADTGYYTPIPRYEGNIQHKLLMCANNGVAGDYGADRKGFRFGIEAAKELGLPITIVGADANTKFFEIHKDLLEYDKLTVIDTNPTEEEKVRIFKEHTIFLHPSNLEYGHPNLTLCEAASMCMPIIGTYKGSKHIYGMWTIPSISTAEVIRGLKSTIERWTSLWDEMIAVRESYDWINVAKKLDFMYDAVKRFENNTSDIVREKYFKTFNVKKL